MGGSGAVRRRLTALLSALVLLVTLGDGAPSVLGGDAPQPTPDVVVELDDRVRLTAEPMLTGNVRGGRWTAIRVRLENDGPAVDAELRVTPGDDDASSHTLPVQLPTGARQEHVLHGRASLLHGRFRVRLIEDGAVIATADVSAGLMDEDAVGVGLVAERPDRLVEAIREAFAVRDGPEVDLDAMGVVDLPSRVQAWAAIDLLIWQDVPARELTADQSDALRAWLAGGGHLLVLAGSMGPGTLEGLPADVLPFLPERMIDAPVADLGGVMADVPAGVDTLPVQVGAPGRGVVLAESGGGVVIGRLTIGRGSSTVVGVDPATAALAGTSAAADLWTRILPLDIRPARDRPRGDDRALTAALSTLPTVSVPRQDQLLALFAAYLLLLGPLNYLVLRRLDRLAWAWITMPALIALFAIAVFLLGVVLKGSSVVTKELAVVRGAVGLAHGVAEIQVSVFSPSRATFDVRVSDGALISGPEARRRKDAVALDVSVGDPGVVRGLQVASGAQRAFRVETSVPVPLVTTDLRLEDGRVVGALTNASDQPLEGVAILHHRGVQLLGDLEPGATAAVDLAPAGDKARRKARLKQVLGSLPGGDAASRSALASRTALLRRAVTQNGPDQPVIVAWRSGVLLEVDVGVPSRAVGDTLILLDAPLRVTGSVLFAGSAMESTMVELAAVSGRSQGSGYTLDRGALTILVRPTAFDGVLAVDTLALRLAPSRTAVGPELEDLTPLPDVLQPDQDDPVGSGPAPTPGADGVAPLPALQLWDRAASRWVEVPPMDRAVSYRVTSPERYVDGSGAFQVRFVVRTDGAPVRFALDVRMEGIAS